MSVERLFALGLAMAGCHFLGDVHDVSFQDGGCVEIADCGTASECQLPVCAEGQCLFTNVARSTPCADGICDGQGNCVGCLGPEDCAPSGPCQNGLCVDQTCINGALDPNESDVDCGGACAPCVQGKDCSSNVDCASGSCIGSTCQGCTEGACLFASDYCDLASGDCVKKKPLGEPCNEDFECATENCSETSNECTFGD